MKDINERLVAWCDDRLALNRVSFIRHQRLIEEIYVSNEKVLEWRRKAADRTITVEDLHEAIAHLRQGRLTAIKPPKAPKAPKKGRQKAPTSQVDLEDLIRQVETL